MKLIQEKSDFKTLYFLGLLLDRARKLSPPKYDSTERERERLQLIVTGKAMS